VPLQPQLRFQHPLQRLFRVAPTIGKRQLLVLNQMSAWKHTLMQDSADKDAVALHPIKDDMPPMLDAVIARPDPIAGAADLWSLNESIEAGLQTVEIAISLLFAPVILGVICNIDQIDPSQLRKLIGGQLSRPARRQSTRPNTIANLAENVSFGNSALFAR
jgi:hypothetical protein